MGGLPLLHPISSRVTKTGYNEQRTSPFLVLNFPLRQMLPFFEYNHLWLLISIVFISAPRVIVWTLRDGRTARNRRPARSTIFELVVIFFVRSSAASKISLHPPERGWDLGLVG